MHAKATATTRSYQDFEPVYEWVQEERSSTILIQVPGFQKENLKVQLGAYLRVTGERPLDGNWWSRFRNEFRVPEQCDVQGIRAKFDNGLLYVILPKLNTTPVDSQEPPAAAAEPKPPTSDEPEGTEKRDSASDFKEEFNAAQQDKQPMAEHMTAGRAASWRERPIMISKPTQLVLNVVVAAAVLVGLAMYAAYKLRSSTEDGLEIK